MKKKLIKSVSLVALSAVMAGGAAISFAGCNNANKEFEISVSMFCGNNEVELNRGICQTWAKEYSEKLRQDGTFEEGQEISIRFSNNADTNDYFSALQRQMGSGKQPDVFYVSPKYVKKWREKGNVLDLSTYLTKEEAEGIWEDSLAFYAYSDDPGYNRGDRISYNGTNFVTTSGAKVGVYGLPKDYSNFGLGFNEVLINEHGARDALTTLTTADRGGAKGAEYNSKDISYDYEEGVITDLNGEDVPLINIGKPTYYKPYNFYSYASYEDAVAGGDPMACAVQQFTGGKGYLVTIPGFPGDTLKEAAEYWDGNTDTEIKVEKDPDAQYDTNEGYVTFTYAEYSAFTWAVTYYYNTYNWDGSGTAGVTTEAGRKNVYGNDQYDGVLYLLPWLAGNAAQYLNLDSTSVINGSTPTQVGTDTYTTSKITLSGLDNDYKVQYGVNSQAFIDTLGAFHAYGSDWNGNSNFAGDTTDTKDSGWDMFCGGNVLFYGVGTWNSGALNNSSRTYLKYRLMPEPVSEDYALASKIKDADYNMKGYGDAAEGKSLKSEYSGQEIFDNQVERQDKWGARMDSVGYGVSGKITSGAQWRAAAAVDLVKYLTVTEETQIALTYAGSQLPNFKQQCVDFYNADPDGAFGKMITPDDEEKWNKVYDIADKMYVERQGANRGMTVKAWIDQYYPGTDYDPSFAQDKLESITQRSTAMRILYLIAYKKSDRDISLRMQYGLNSIRDSAMYTYNSDWLGELEPRQKNMVLAYENRTSYKDKMASILKDNILRGASVESDISKNVLPEFGQRYATPMWFCLHQAQSSQEKLEAAIQLEG